MTNYEHTDSDGNLLTVEHGSFKHLGIFVRSAGTHVDRAAVVRLVSELQKWLEETPSVEVMREAIDSDPDSSPGVVAPREAPVPETTALKPKVRLRNLPYSVKVLVEVTKLSDSKLRGPGGAYWVDSGVPVSPA